LTSTGRNREDDLDFGYIVAALPALHVQPNLGGHRLNAIGEELPAHSLLIARVGENHHTQQGDSQRDSAQHRNPTCGLFH
jgi:hypothetical protein